MDKEQAKVTHEHIENTVLKRADEQFNKTKDEYIRTLNETTKHLREKLAVALAHFEMIENCNTTPEAKELASTAYRILSND